jgi:hypothetical protein
MAGCLPGDPTCRRPGDLLRRPDARAAERVAIKIIPNVLGDDIKMIRRSSRYVIPWLQAVLSDSPPGQTAVRARTLLDRLAAAGDDWALTVQRQLEA